MLGGNPDLLRNCYHAGGCSEFWYDRHFTEDRGANLYGTTPTPSGNDKADVMPKTDPWDTVVSKINTNNFNYFVRTTGITHDGSVRTYATTANSVNAQAFPISVISFNGSACHATSGAWSVSFWYKYQQKDGRTSHPGNAQINTSFVVTSGQHCGTGYYAWWPADWENSAFSKFDNTSPHFYYTDCIATYGAPKSFLSMSDSEFDASTTDNGWTHKTLVIENDNNDIFFVFSKNHEAMLYKHGCNHRTHGWPENVDPNSCLQWNRNTGEEPEFMLDELHVTCGTS